MAPATATAAASAARSMTTGGVLPHRRPRTVPGNAKLTTAAPRPRANSATGSSSLPGLGPRRRRASLPSARKREARPGTA
eukprot:6134832-Heterocapsa_arctica.AAC.1